MVNGTFVPAAVDPSTGVACLTFAGTSTTLDPGQAITFSVEFRTYPGIFTSHVVQGIA